MDLYEFYAMPPETSYPCDEKDSHIGLKKSCSVRTWCRCVCNPRSLLVVFSLMTISFVVAMGFVFTLPVITGSDEEVNEMYTLIHNVGICLGESKIEWWAEGGTLLGAARHGGVLPADDDFDIGIQKKHEIHFSNQTSATNQCLQKRGYAAVWSWFCMCYKVVSPKFTTREVMYAVNWPWVDVFLYDFDNLVDCKVIARSHGGEKMVKRIFSAPAGPPKSKCADKTTFSADPFCVLTRDIMGEDPETGVLDFRNVIPVDFGPTKINSISNRDHDRQREFGNFTPLERATQYAFGSDAMSMVYVTHTHTTDAKSSGPFPLKEYTDSYLLTRGVKQKDLWKYVGDQIPKLPMKKPFSDKLTVNDIKIFDKIGAGPGPGSPSFGSFTIAGNLLFIGCSGLWCGCLTILFFGVVLVYC